MGPVSGMTAREKQHRTDLTLLLMVGALLVREQLGPPSSKGPGLASETQHHSSITHPSKGRALKDPLDLISLCITFSKA